MADKQNFTALEWVSGEIAETLKEASQLLEAFVANPEDATKIRFCLNHIHQVFNILQMVELHGGALLAEEMEHLAAALIEHKVQNATDAHEVLMRAILQLPTYLERVKAARTDDPASLMGLLNDLRAVRGENLFTETQLFGPDMRAAHQVSGPRVKFDEAAYSGLLTKLKQSYEKVMFQVMRDRQIDDQLPTLNKIFENFKKICQGTARAPMWDVCLAVVEGIESDSIAASVAMNNLLRQIDGEIGQMQQLGVAGLDVAPPDELVKNLLYYIALANKPSAKIDQIKALYKLELALPGANPSQMLAPDNSAMSSVVGAIVNEFKAVKALLDQYAAGQSVEAHDAQQAINAIKQAADTLAVLGLGEQRRQLAHVAEQLQQQIQAGRTDFDALMDLAAQLMTVEAELHRRYSPDAAGSDTPKSLDFTMLSAQESVLTECHNGLEQAKEGIVEYIGSQWNKASLTQIPAVLQQVRGGLTIIQQVRAAKVIGSCIKFIDEKMIQQDQPPSFDVLDLLADAITSIEYYLECLDEDVVEDHSKTLTLAEQSVAQLGYPVAAKSAADYLEAAALEAEIDAEPAVAVLQTASEASGDISLDFGEPVVEASAVEEAVVEAPVIEAHAVETSVVEAIAEPELVVEPAPVVAVAPVAPVPVAVAEVAADLPEEIDAPLNLDDWDDEIAEIFIEEVEEVLEAINDYYPQWKANKDDNFALTEFRRGFHTLKGSGRMAKALQIGELAWSVENMVNRVLDGSIEASDDVCTVIEQVTAKVPSMLAAFAAKKVDPQPALSARLSAAAFALSAGQPMPSLAAPEAGSAPVSAEAPAVELSVYQARRMPAADCEKMDASLDITLWEIFASEAETHLEVVDEWLAYASEQAPLPVDPTDPLQRALHTLKGSAHMAEVTPIADLASPLEKLVKSLRAYQIKVGAEFSTLLAECVDEIRYGLSLIEEHRRVVLPNTDDLVARISELDQVGGSQDATANAVSTVDLTRFNTFLMEELDVLMDPTEAVTAWAAGDDSAIARVVFELAAMRDATNDAGFTAVGSLISPLLSLYENVQSQPARQVLLPSALTAQQLLVDYMDQLAASEDLQEATDLIAVLSNFDTSQFAETPVEVQPQVVTDDVVLDEPVLASVAVAPVVAANSNADDVAMLADLDRDMLEIFLEEADELLEGLGEEIYRWEQDPADSQADALRRTLHTFKGGARMSGLMLIGELAHDLETDLEFRSGAADSALFARLNQCQDALYRGVQMVRGWLAGDEAQVNFAALLPQRAVVAELAPVAEVAEVAEVEETFALVLEESADTSLQSALDLLGGAPEDAPILTQADDDLGLDFSLDSVFESDTVFETQVPVLANEAADISLLLDEPVADVLSLDLDATDTALVPVLADAEDDFSLLLDEQPAAELALDFAVEEAPVVPVLADAEDDFSLLLDEQPAAELALDFAAEEAPVAPVLADAEDDFSLLLDEQPAAELALDFTVEEAPVVPVLADVEDVADLDSLTELLSESTPEVAIESETELAVEPVAVELAAMESVAAAAPMVLPHDAELDPEMLEIFLEEADELAEELEQLVASWQAMPENAAIGDSLRRNLHTLKGGARMCGLKGLGELAHDLETELEFFSGTADTALLNKVQAYQDDILAGIGQGRALATGQAPAPFVSRVLQGSSATDSSIEAAIIEPVLDTPVLDASAAVEFDLAAELEQPVLTVADETVFDEPVIEDGSAVEDNSAIEALAVIDDVVAIEDTVAIEAEVQPEVAAPAQDPLALLGLSADIDNEMLEIFVEEANELLDELETHIGDWRADADQASMADAIKRTLHTYKGGARMAGVMGLGQLAHDLESTLEFHQGAASAELFADLDACNSKLLAGTALLRRLVAGETLAQLAGGSETIAEATSVVDNTAVADGTVAQDDTAVEQASADIVDIADHKLAVESAPVAQSKPAAKEESAKIIPFRSDIMPRGLPEAIAGKKALHAALEKQASQQQQEQIKVSAELLENLVNLAGETSINRARVEQQMIDMARSTDEMDAVIKRLEDQLRRLEAETDAQIQSRLSEIQERSDDFDPLEMDRYSTLQQLTSSLSESSSDLIDVRNSLSNKLRDTETLLVQQARINTSLQEGLMRSRMVPFSRLEPRLRRIVRQVAQELGKDIVLELQNVQGELDRTMLDRMIAPLEHMLRNACDHGIEMPEKRSAAGKTRQGKIILSLGRDGGDILLTLKDDGGGINVEAVRKKAIERGLLTEDSQASDADIVQFILHAGFSTAEKVTQISGRGVGMDVVSSEIKAMGGSVSIQSEFGRGSEFTVRLPFTVSVNRALMVRVGEESYAIPLSSIEGIVRVSPYELEAYYEDPTQRFNYAGRDYEVRYMGAMLQTKMRPNIEQSLLPEPMLLVRSAEHTVALHVDQLIGSREIVVKALGTQFAQVPGLSGATLLGDGSVVVILDLIALVRARQVIDTQQIDTQSQMPAMDETMTVMVCDDSVTVRKVTSRLLEREGFSVMTAKDGADALLQMQERIPDVLLLDIEMPRMDGFEVASTMKNSQRLQDVPIIMITSRTGAKHKERAEQMGVERYMGKPYVEEELLNNINDLIGERLVRRMARYEQSQH